MMADIARGLGRRRPAGAAVRFLGRLRLPLAFAGPALLASVAYVDPGNIAVGLESGARYGYALLWVVLAANLVAMLFQSLAAKLGIVRGDSLAALCRKELAPRLAYPMWAVSELGAVATDFAELVGAAISLSLLLRLPLTASVAITGAATWAILLWEQRRFRALEATVAALLLIIALAYLMQTLLAGPDWGRVAYHAIVPSLPDRGAAVLAAGIVGATVMPHALYLHSSLAQHRAARLAEADKRRQIRASNIAVVLALGFAGLINMAIVCVAAARFHIGDPSEPVGLADAYDRLRPFVGGLAAFAYLVALLASGLSSSVTGTMAGQGIMEDFLAWRVAPSLRRLATLLPALAIAALSADATWALVLSQVVLSLVLPVPMLALLIATSRRRIMGPFANRPVATLAASLAAAAILALNLALVVGLVAG